MKKWEPEKVDLSQTNLRYVVVLLAVLLCFGIYFIYDNPSALQPQLMDWLNMNSLEYKLTILCILFSQLHTSSIRRLFNRFYGNPYRNCLIFFLNFTWPVCISPCSRPKKLPSRLGRQVYIRFRRWKFKCDPMRFNIYLVFGQKHLLNFWSQY